MAGMVSCRYYNEQTNHGDTVDTVYRDLDLMMLVPSCIDTISLLFIAGMQTFEEYGDPVEIVAPILARETHHQMLAPVELCPDGTLIVAM
jgi:hypothetical protein